MWDDIMAVLEFLSLWFLIPRWFVFAAGVRLSADVIPSALGNLAALTHMDLEGNQLTGMRSNAVRSFVGTLQPCSTDIIVSSRWFVSPRRCPRPLVGYCKLVQMKRWRVFPCRELVGTCQTQAHPRSRRWSRQCLVNDGKPHRSIQSLRFLRASVKLLPGGIPWCCTLRWVCGFDRPD